MRVGVVAADGGDDDAGSKSPGDPRNTYSRGMEWAGDAAQLVIQQLNRLQNPNDVLLADAAHRRGAARCTATSDSAWVDVVDDVAWIDGGKAFLWVSERDGWRHLYRVAARRHGDARCVTPGDADVIDVARVDETAGWVYFIASPDERDAALPLPRAARRQRHARARDARRSSPARTATTISPDGRWAIHTFSRVRHAAGHRPRQPAGPQDRAHAGGQRGAARRRWRRCGARRPSSSRSTSAAASRSTAG